jgi:hypothetical protein
MGRWGGYFEILSGDIILVRDFFTGNIRPLAISSHGGPGLETMLCGELIIPFRQIHTHEGNNLPCYR